MRTLFFFVPLTIGVGAAAAFSIVGPQGVFVAYACASMDRGERAGCYETLIPDVTAESEPVLALELIRNLQRIDTALADCHAAAHRIGEMRATVDPARWADLLSSEPEDGICWYGYSHGVLTGSFKREAHRDFQALIPTFRTFCDADRSGKMRSRVSRQACLHGLGHALYFLADEDLEAGMRRCDEIVEHPYERAMCLNGVAMPRFGVHGADRQYFASSAQAREAAESFCRSLSSEAYAAACVRSSWMLYWNDIMDGDGIDALCGRFEDVERSLCYTRVFVGVGWALRHDPERLARVCDRVDEEYAGRCFASYAFERTANTGGERGVPYGLASCAAAGRWEDACVSALAHDIARYAEHGTEERKHICARFPERAIDECVNVP